MVWDKCIMKCTTYDYKVIQSVPTALKILCEEWIKKMQYIYTMGYYSAIKMNELLPLVATWMDLESVILSEVS